MRLVRPSAAYGTSIQGPELEPYPTYNAGTTYALGDLVLHLDNDGLSVAYNIYESAQASNTGHDVSDPAWWTFVGASNPYRMFDQVANSQSTAEDQINVNLYATPLANTIALLNVSGTSVTVTVTINASGGGYPPAGDVVYSQTRSLLVAGDGVSNWYEYFFGDMARRTDVLFADIPSYADQVITVTLDGPGETVAIGTLAVGYGYDIGETQLGSGIGITDYSRKQVDDFGQFQIVERDYSRRGRFTVVIPNTRLDEIANLLPQYRAVPVVWIGADDYGATFIYGFYKDYDITIQYRLDSVYTLQIEGLS